MRSNLLGTEFVLYDNGVNPNRKTSGGQMRTELGSVLFDKNVQGNVPRKMTVLTPNRDDNGALSRFQPKGIQNEDSIAASFRDGDLANITVLQNISPKWDPQRNCFTINFGGRCKCASIKNFQLVENNSPTVVLQFGKWAKDEFTLDVRWPLSPLQAFSIVLASFDPKLGAQ